MKESTAWQTLGPAIKTEAELTKHAIHVVRIEAMTTAGVFDTSCCYRGNDFWLEGKYLEQFPVKPTSLVKVGLSEGQELFATRRLLAGGKLFLWLKVGNHANSRGKGWYLFRLDTLDIIKKARYGFTLKEIEGSRHETAKLLSKKLLEDCQK